MKRPKILVSAYACEPGFGSEPGIGWNIARGLVGAFEVWVITRESNRARIEVELADSPVPGLKFVFHDLPGWARWWKRGQRGVRLYYYLWQLSIYSLIRRLQREVGFETVHHVTFGRYWTPSLLAVLPVPFVWGPVGGGESTPRALFGTLGLRGKAYEMLRNIGRWVGEHDPLVRLTARRSSLALATTEETSTRLSRLGAGAVRLFSQVGLPEGELCVLESLPPPPSSPVRFISTGRLLAWKGVHLGISAFAQSGLEEAEYWIVGEGPERGRLERLARAAGIADKVRFGGKVPREEVFKKLSDCHILVHPSLHDSGGWVCLEAMAAGKPVICLDQGGPALQVTEETGIKVAAHTPEQAVRDLALAMRRLATDPALRTRLGENARRHVRGNFAWPVRVAELSRLIASVLQQSSLPPKFLYPSATASQ